MKLPCKVHPLASVFPVMSDAEFQKLKADIAEHGQKDPIVFWKEQLVDGRHRYRACLELGITPFDVMVSDDADPVAYVLAANLHRRHLTTTQRAIVAARLATLERGRPSKDDDNRQNCLFIDQETAAQLLGTSITNVKKAKQLLQCGHPDLIEAVERGEVSVNLAAKLVSLEPDQEQQAELVSGGKEAIRIYLTPPDELPEKQEKCPEEKVLFAFRRAENRLNALRRIVSELDAKERAVLIEWLAAEE